ncbi:DUF4245 domain-containing protein [Nocardioides marmoribigeumensis]|jgi:hypothetical protein|uniref:DUF4245 domain-containing protein n=1 Tax=Nocardioides marmoribigeumensis TaxID=433649 RepID=A0ABU2BX85_9ACTN|nr:DUF4245 domain-containing protein [Nocardioides marmoribigeumensis]MDR7363019.1 hypothetical protein [Nocardioides marmoribigeumensis]
MSAQAGRYQRSVSGMVGAMVVLLAVIGGYVAFRAVNRNDVADPVTAFDWRGPATYARQQADFTVLTPSRLPDGWIATSARWTGGREQHWHLGLLTGQRQYVGVEQEDRSVDDMVHEYVDPDAARGKDVRIDGRTWQSWFDDQDQALVLEQEDVTTLVVGTLDRGTVEDFVATLR